MWNFEEYGFMSKHKDGKKRVKTSHDINGVCFLRFNFVCVCRFVFYIFVIIMIIIIISIVVVAII